MSLSLPDSALPRRLLVVDPDVKHARSALQPLRALGAKVDWAQAIPDSIEAYDVVLVDLGESGGAQRDDLMAKAASARTHSKTRVVYSLGGQRREELAHLWQQGDVPNFLARKAELDPDDLLATVQKLLRGDIFGMEKYFRWAAEQTPFRLTRSQEKADLLASAEAYAQLRGVHPLLMSRFITVVDELVSNAFYDAPVDAAGHHLYADWPRSREVVLEPGQAVTVTLCCDGKRLGVSVVDPFGSLRSPDVQRYLARCARGGADQIKPGTGGAGLGLYQVFEGSHFVANIEPRRRTEVIGLMDLQSRFRDYATQPKSMNIFVST